ncbi:FIST signal transduction protein [Catellatospora sp. TT07R-123]|uniref:FIST signal transduction protein n=1 Tax=Catellatospora sp. TT07R-123 TaxID=2733863 RepID=UPI001BB323CF|nr:FIST N-terminal domain-containing protein [Catellatospora sp. TT07R-123]
MPVTPPAMGGVSAASRVRASVGTSQAPDSVEAGTEAATAALAGLGGGEPALIIMYASIRYDLAVLLHTVRRLTAPTPLVGATSSGHFQDGVLTIPGSGVSVLALTAGDYRFGTASVTGIREHAVQAGQQLARAARAAAGPRHDRDAAMILLATGLSGHQQELLNGVHRVVGAKVPVVGGSAGDDRLLARTCVFDGDRLLTDGGAAAVWVDSPWPLNVVADHGWEAVSLPLLITRTDGHVVCEIGGRPAADVFREHFDPHAPQRPPGLVRPAPGYLSAYGFGLIEPDGTQVIRGAYLDGDGRLRTFTPLPPYAAVQIVSCTSADLLGVIDDVVREAVDGREASVLLAFSCVARLDVLADQGPVEAALIQEAAGKMTTFGIYTYGEFARTTRVAGFHNATLTAIAL